MYTSVSICVVVTPEHFENVTDVLVHDAVTLPCKTSPDSSVVWYYQQSCDNFEHGMYMCSNPIEVAIRNQYQIRRNAPGEINLLINDVAKTMMGLYTCKDHYRVHYRVLLNVISKYESLLSGHLYL